MARKVFLGPGEIDADLELPAGKRRRPTPPFWLKHDGETAVYRIWGDGGHLLYVGISRTPKTRLLSHRRKPWWDLVDVIAVEWFDTRAEALDIEGGWIRERSPAFNRLRPKEST